MKVWTLTLVTYDYFRWDELQGIYFTKEKAKESIPEDSKYGCYLYNDEYIENASMLRSREESHWLLMEEEVK